MTPNPRNFIPGECTVGPSAPNFAKLDQGSHNPKLVALAEAACRSCLQLAHCQEQETGIRQALAVRGVGQTVVGASLNTPQPLTETDSLQDTSFVFNLEQPLDDPRHMLEIIRQGFRSGQVSRVGGKPFRYHAVLAAHLEHRLVQTDSKGRLNEQEIQQISRTAADMALRYNVAARPPQKRRRALSEADMASAAALQGVFFEDFLDLREGGYPEPIVLAKAHNPTFYERIMQHFSANVNVSQGQLRNFFRNTPMDPLSRISAYLEKKQWKDQKEWITEKARALYDTDTELRKALTYITLFMKRKYVCVTHADVRAVSTFYNTIDEKTGAYLVADEALAYFTSEEKEAIFLSFGLDRIMLGYDVDPEKLQTFFRVDDIDEFVDNHLLPYARCPATSPSSSAEILYKLRYIAREPDLLQRARIPTDPAFDKTFAATLQILTANAEVTKEHDITSPQCNHRLRQLVARICFVAPAATATVQLLADTAVTYLNDAAEIKALGNSKAYETALGYSGTFCRNLYARTSQKDSDLYDAPVSQLLYRNSTGQVVATLRRYENLVTTLAPHFRARKLGNGLLRQLCQASLYTPDKIIKRLDTYDTLKQSYATNMKVPNLAISYYSLYTCPEDPAAEVKAWVSATAKAGNVYRDKIDQSIINTFALTKRGDELTAALNTYLKTVNRLTAIYSKIPHQAIDRGVLERAAASSDPTSWMTAYLGRWSAIQKATDTSDIEAFMLRRLVSIYSTDPIHVIEAYRGLKARYREDDYIEAWMIDEAVKWSIAHAARSLRKLRVLLRSTDRKFIRLDKPIRYGGRRSQHEVIADPRKAFSPEELTERTVDPEAPTREQTRIMRSMEALSDPEKAVVALIYQLPWLLPQSMQDGGWTESEKVCSLFKTASVAELEPIAKQTVAKLSE